MLKRIIQFFAKRGYALILGASFLLLIVLLFKFNQSNRDEIERFQHIFLAQIEAAALAHEAFVKQAAGAAPKKVIVVPGRLVNIVV